MAMRIELPDEPYSLGRIATALGDLGANILHIDVHELDGSDVIDEVVIAGPDSLSPSDVRQALLAAGARTVVSVPLVHRHMDALVRALNALVTFCRDPSDEGLLSVIPSVVPVEGVAIEPIRDLDGIDPTGRQLRWGTPAARCVGKSWVLAVPRVEHAPTPVDALVVRRANRFSATEVARLRALLLLVAHLTRSADAAG